MALVDRDDPYHAKCAAALETISSEDFVTTWPCLTEAMYLLGNRRGFIAQEDLWDYVAEGVIRLYQPSLTEWERIHTLMRQYKDTPMDVADASLVVAGERLDLARIFTIDNHFRAYRLNGRDAFDVVP